MAHSAMSLTWSAMVLLTGLVFVVLVGVLVMVLFDKTRRKAGALVLIPLVVGAFALASVVLLRFARQERVTEWRSEFAPRIKPTPLVRMGPTSTPPAPATQPPSAAPQGGEKGRPTMIRALADSVKGALQALPPMRTERLKREAAEQEEAELRTLKEAERRAEQVKQTETWIATALRTEKESARQAEPAKQTDAAKTPPKGAPSGTPAARVTAEAEDPAAKGPARAPATRPEWLDAIAAETDSPTGFSARVIEGTYQMVVKAGPYESRQECESTLPDALQRGVRQFIARDLGEEAADRIRLPLEYVATRVVKDQFTEPVTTSFGPMVQVHALLRFDREVQARIGEQWNRVLVNRRLWHAGGGLAGVLMLLSVVYGYLKTDLATQGAYRGRLRLLGGTLILAVLAAGLALVG